MYTAAALATRRQTVEILAVCDATMRDDMVQDQQ
jgi:hypothetical protein